MIKIGFLRRTKNKWLNPAEHFRVLFYVAANFVIELILFTQEDVDFENGTVRGTILKNNKPVSIVTEIPKVIDNHPWGNKHRAFQTEIEKHARLLCPKTKISKLKQYNMLLEDGRFSDILLKTKSVKSISRIDDFIDSYSDVVIKPAKGHMGENVLKLSKSGGGYLLTEQHETVEMTRGQLERYYTDSIEDKDFVIQPYINSSTRLGEPLDIRVYARRGAGGKFVADLCPRIGSAAGVTSNIAGGGYSIPVEKLLPLHFGGKHKEILEQLQYIGENFPDYYQSFFDETMFDIGLDIGISRETGKLYLFEVNNFIKPFTVEMLLKDAVTRCEYYLFSSPVF